MQVVDECPPLGYSCLTDQELIRELQRIWVRLEEKAIGQDHTSQQVRLPNPTEKCLFGLLAPNKADASNLAY